MKIQTVSRTQGSKGARKIIGLKILKIPTKGKHNFRRDFLQQFREFHTVTDDRITMHTVDGDVNFKVDYPPGRHCLTCGEKLPDGGADPFGKKCRAHVAKHGDEAEKTGEWPHGYIATKAYLTTVED